MVWRKQVLPYFIDLLYRQFSVVAAIVEFYNEHVSKLQKLHNVSSHSHCHGMFVETINMRMICFLTAAARMASSPLLCSVSSFYHFFSYIFVSLAYVCVFLFVFALHSRDSCVGKSQKQMDTVFFAFFSSSSSSSSSSLSRW